MPRDVVWSIPFKSGQRLGKLDGFINVEKDESLLCYGGRAVGNGGLFVVTTYVVTREDGSKDQRELKEYDPWQTFGKKLDVIFDRVLTTPDDLGEGTVRIG